VTLVAIQTCILSDFSGSIDKGVEDADSATKKNVVKPLIALPNGSRLTAITTTGITQHCLLIEARLSSEELDLVGC
jgi:hypothetical protein